MGKMMKGGGKKGKPAFHWGDGGKGGRKRPAAGGEPEAKRPKKGPEELRRLIGAAVYEELCEAARQVVRDAHEGGAHFFAGSCFSKALVERQPESATKVKEALGGKGWLRHFMAHVA